MGAADRHGNGGPRRRQVVAGRRQSGRLGQRPRRPMERLLHGRRAARPPGIGRRHPRRPVEPQRPTAGRRPVRLQSESRATVRPRFFFFYRVSRILTEFY